jgi:hypothetical protein
MPTPKELLEDSSLFTQVDSLGSGSDEIDFSEYDGLFTNTQGVVDWNQKLDQANSINRFGLDSIPVSSDEEVDVTKTNSALRQVGGLGLEIGAGITTDQLTAPLLVAPVPGARIAYGVINFGSGYASNVAAQKIRGDEFSYGEAIAAGLFQMIPFGSTGKGVKGLAGAGLQGGVTAGGETTVRTAIDEQRLPTAGEFNTAATIGTVFGTGFKGSVDFLGSLSKKFQGKSAAEIDSLITNEDKSKLEELLKNADSDEAKKIAKGIREGDIGFTDADGLIDEIVDGATYEQLINTKLQPFQGLEEGGIGKKRRGAEYLKKRILKQFPVKGADPIDAEETVKFIDKFADRLDDVSISVTNKIGPQGRYNFATNLIQIRQKTIDEGELTDTMIHELWHSLSRYLPKKDLDKLNKDFQVEKLDYLTNLNKKIKDKSLSKGLLVEYTNELNMFKKGTGYTAENYRYKDIDEFFAENLKDISLERLDDDLELAPSGTWKRITQEVSLFIRDLFVSLKAKLGGPQSQRIYNDFLKNKNVVKQRKGPLDSPEFDEAIEGSIEGMAGDIRQAKVESQTKDLPDLPGKKKKKKKQDLGDETILPNQVNPDQIGNTPSQVRFLEKVLRGAKTLEENGFYRVKTTEDQTDEVIQLLQDSPALKEKAKLMAQIYKLIPTDSLNRALAEYVTLTNQRIANTNGSLIEALGTLGNPQQIEDLSEQLIKNFDDLDEWLRLGMPLRSEAGRGLGALAVPTKGIEPEEWLKLSPNERYRFNKAQSGDVNIATGHSSVKLKNLQENIRKAVAEGKESGDFSKLNKLVNTVKRAKGNPEKLEKLVGMELLDRILDPNTYLRPLNEVLINAVLFSPTTQEINFVSNALEAYMAPLELALDPKNIIDPGQLRMAKEHFIAMHSDFNFALKAFQESWQKQENVLAPGRIKSDFEDRFVISMDDEGLTYGDNFRQKLLADSINFFGDYIVRPSGRFMGSMDALFMSGALRGSSVSRAWLGGWEKGLRGQELADYTKKHSGVVWESIVKRSGKGITDDESAEIYESVREFGKRSTYTEDIRTDGSVVGPIAKGMQGLASIPLVRRFQLFTRSPVNIIKRGFRRTPVLNMMMKEFRYDLLESPDPFVRKQTRGQLALSVLATGGFVGLIHGQNYMKVETQDVVKRRTKAGNPPNIVLTGGGPDTSTSAGRELYWSQWKDGWRPYSYAKLQKNEDGTPQIDANGNYQYIHHSYKRLDPLSSWIGFLVDMHQVEEHMTDGQYQEMMGAFMVAFGRNFTDRTFMQGIGDAANFWLNPGRAEKWLSRQAASNIPQSNLWRYMKRLPGDLLEMKGLPPEEIERWQVKPDMTVRPGDKEFGGLASSLNNLSATVPGYGKGLPPQREHITNKFITYPKRYGPDVLNWVESSPTRNIPILSELKKLGQILPEPPDTISHSNKTMRENSVPYKLNGTQYDELKYLVNTIENPNTGFTLEEALMDYTKTQNYKENMAIIESQDTPLEVPDAVSRIMDSTDGFNSINQMYIQQGIDKWIELTGEGAYNKQVEIKRENDFKYLELLNKARQESELNLSPN